MKHLFYIIIMFFGASDDLYAQHILPPFSRDFSKMVTVDSSKIRIWYAFNALNIQKPETYDDLQRLEVGLKLSKYFSHFVYNSDSLCTEWKKKEKNTLSIPRWLGASGKKENWNEYQYTDYFRIFNTQKLIENIFLPRPLPSCQIIEKIPIQEWKIWEDTTTIADYLCQKATCLFRGRNFIAWFTTDIPMNNGPWKFGGLPGLILKVYDVDKLYNFECVKVEFLEEYYQIKWFNQDYKQMNQKEFRKLMIDLHEDFAKTTGRVPFNRNRIVKIPYDPIELEYK